jgi:lactobin A/cerein 7B family class IIb bacteriocin
MEYNIMRELNVNEIESVSGGVVIAGTIKKVGIVGAIDYMFEFFRGFVEAIEDINE